MGDQRPLGVEQYVGGLIGRYRNSGVLVDSNLLLLYLVGAYDPRQLGRHSRTEQFAPEDFDLLLAFLQQFERIVTTPHVLAETSNLMGQLTGRVRAGCFALLAEIVARMHEHHTPATTIVVNPAFAQFGVADTAIYDASPSTYLVLTDDLPLSGYLRNRGVDVLNFNNIRQLG